MACLTTSLFSRLDSPKTRNYSKMLSIRREEKALWEMEAGAKIYTALIANAIDLMVFNIVTESSMNSKKMRSRSLKRMTELL